MHIVMTGKGKQGLKVTLHHTFDTCVSKHNPFMHAVESYGTVVVMAKDIKAGDCLHTADGKRSVRSAAPAIVQEGDVTYSIKLADKISTVAIGGVFTHAMGHLRNKHRTPSSFEEQEKKYKKVNTQAHLQLSHSNDK
jgi:copper homeostasis protein CutC